MSLKLSIHTCQQDSIPVGCVPYAGKGGGGWVRGEELQMNKFFDQVSSPGIGYPGPMSGSLLYNVTYPMSGGVRVSRFHMQGERYRTM